MQWFNSYLCDRKQRIVSQEGPTDFLEINRGVPQGSALSPLLFNIYIRNLPRSITSESIEFADDVTVSEQDRSIEVVKERLVNSFKDLKQFCQNRDLVINGSKIQFIVMKAPDKKLLVEDSMLILDKDAHPSSFSQAIRFYH